MVSIAQSSVSEHRESRYPNNRPIASNCAAAARFSARAAAHLIHQPRGLRRHRGMAPLHHLIEPGDHLRPRRFIEHTFEYARGHRLPGNIAVVFDATAICSVTR